MPVTAMVKERRRVKPLGWRQRWALVSPKLPQSGLVARSAPVRWSELAPRSAALLGARDDTDYDERTQAK